MPRILPPIDINDIRELYLSGKTIQQIADILGVSTSYLNNRAKRAGFKFSDLRPPLVTQTRVDKIILPMDEVKRLWDSGMPKKHIAQHFGVGEMTIHKRMREAGIGQFESLSEANRHRMAQLSPEERRNLVKNAHNAIRGKKRSRNELLKRATTRERIGKIDSVHEQRFADILTDNGIDFTPQKAIGVYNCDFAIGSVAVEINGGYDHNIGKPARLRPKRMRYILNSGWNMYIIWTGPGCKYLSPDVLDDLIAFLERSSTDPSFVGQYRVVWGNGKLVSTGGKDSHDFSNVSTRGRRFNSRRKNLHT